jgi:hypothetical protein
VKVILGDMGDMVYWQRMRTALWVHPILEGSSINTQLIRLLDGIEVECLGPTKM